MALREASLIRALIKEWNVDIETTFKNLIDYLEARDIPYQEEVNDRMFAGVLVSDGRIIINQYGLSLVSFDTDVDEALLDLILERLEGEVVVRRSGSGSKGLANLLEPKVSQPGLPS